MTLTTLARVRGCLLGAALGDALGAPFEGQERPQPHHVLAWLRSDEPLRWTDDTALTIALTERLVTTDPLTVLDMDLLAADFAATRRADPTRGYGPGAARVLDAVTRGADWQDAAGALFDGQGSMGNGGAMRVAPVGLLAFARGVALRDVLTLARRSAAVTHAHPLAQDAAALQAAAVALSVTSLGRHGLGAHTVARRLAVAVGALHLRRPLAEVAALAHSHARPELTAQTLGNGVLAHESVPAALTAWLAHIDQPLHAVRYAIAVGGDTDTIASMTGALAGARSGSGGWPQQLLARLEDLDRITAPAAALTRRLHGGDACAAAAPRCGASGTSLSSRHGSGNPRP